MNVRNKSQSSKSTPKVVTNIFTKCIYVEVQKGSCHSELSCHSVVSCHSEWQLSGSKACSPIAIAEKNKEEKA